MKEVFEGENFPQPTRHTAEPWRVNPEQPFEIHGNGNRIAATLLVFGDDRVDVANAAHIVSCVNALAGLRPEAVAGLVAAAEHFASLEGTELYHTNTSVQVCVDMTLAALDALRA